MRHAPVLAVTCLPKGDGCTVARIFRVEGGLHYLRGNSAPYFSLTYTAHRKGFPNQCVSGGAGHTEILTHFPHFADLAALHLADADGAPLYAVANGWYALAGYFGAASGARFHAGNSARHMPVTPHAETPWQTTEYRAPTSDECLTLFAAHCRISLDEAQAIAAAMRPLLGADQEAMKAALTPHIEALRPRWRQQAEACIRAHNLRLYGDPWPDPA